MRKGKSVRLPDPAALKICSKKGKQLTGHKMLVASGVLWLADGTEIDDLDLLGPGESVYCFNPLSDQEASPGTSDCTASSSTSTPASAHERNPRTNSNLVSSDTGDASGHNLVVPGSAEGTHSASGSRNVSAQSSVQSSVAPSQAVTLSEVDPQVLADVVDGEMWLSGRFSLGHEMAIAQYEDLLQSGARVREQTQLDFVRAVTENPTATVDELDKLNSGHAVGFPKQVVHVSAGPNTTLAADANGAAWSSGPPLLNFVCRGSKAAGELPKDGRPYCIDALNGRHVLATASGPFHSAVLVAGRQEVVLFGYNINCSTLGERGADIIQEMQSETPNHIAAGQLGTRKKMYSAPRVVSGLHGTVLSVACGAAHTLALSRGAVYSFGANDEGQLGRTDDKENLVAEIQALTGKKVVRVAAGAHHSLAVTNKGWVYSWGYNDYLQLGRATETKWDATPQRIDDLAKLHIVDVAAGNWHSCALGGDGLVWTFGSNRYGALGRGGSAQSAQSPAPGRTAPLAPRKAPWASSADMQDRAVGLACGPSSVAVWTRRGDCYVWGQLAGENHLSHVNAPRRIEQAHGAPHFVVRAAVGLLHRAMLCLPSAADAMRQLRLAARDEAHDADKLQAALASFDPPHLLGPIQERVHLDYLEEKPKAPIVLLSKAHFVINLKDNSARASQALASEAGGREFSQSTSNYSVPFEVQNASKGAVDILLTPLHVADGWSVKAVEPRTTLKKGKSCSMQLVVVAPPQILRSERLTVTLMSEGGGLRIQHFLCIDLMVHQFDPRDAFSSARGASSKQLLGASGVQGGGLSSLDFQSANLQFFEKLGSGGSGASVFRCTANGFTCACKVLDESMTSMHERESFVKEIEFVESLRHPNVVQYLGHDFSGGKIRLFMEFYPTSLINCIDAAAATKSGMKIDDIRMAAVGLASGLMYLHDHNPPIVHRDVKAANVLTATDETGSLKDVKLTDFDVSRILRPGVQLKTIAGTPGFAAPEVYQKTGYGVLVDIWSYGMVLFQMITCKIPYEECKNLAEIHKKVMSYEKPDLPPVKRKELTGLVTIMNQCFQKPEGRPSAKEILRQLSGWST